MGAPCKGCGVRHDPMWRCTDPRIVGNVTPATAAPRNVTAHYCAECDRLRVKLADAEGVITALRESGRKRVKAYRERRKGNG